MADVIVYLLAYAGERVHHQLKERRSPLIPPPPSPLSCTSIAEAHDLAPVYSREPLEMSPVATRPHISDSRLSRSASALTSDTPNDDSSTRTRAQSIGRPSPRSRSQSATTPSVKAPPPLTENSLREAHLAWKLRYQSLYLRLATLLDAMKRGLRNSWAGKVTWEKCDQVRLAILEAEYVMRKLGEAVEWCDTKGLQKLPLVALVAGKRRSSVSRPTHSECPPSLAYLPSPLPPAPPALLTKLTVPLPPSVFRPGRPESVTDDGVATTEDPPPYRRHYDPFRGERIVEHARWEENRVPDGSDVMLLIR